MKKVISYRQKVIELARIYKIAKVLDENQKLTTYEIELELLRNKVPIPSRRGYLSHKILNEFFKPIYNTLKEKFEIKINTNKNVKFFFRSVKEKLTININVNKIFKNFFEGINNSFSFVVSSITNFFKTLTRTIVESLNNVYNFKVNEKIINKLILRSVLASFLLMFVFGGFYIKSYVSNLDSLKISLEIKSDKNKKEKTSVSKDINTNKKKKIKTAEK